MTTISADITCDLSPEMLADINVQTVPYHIFIDGHNYKDNVDIFPKEIFSIYERTGSLPQTSAINISEYTEHFKKLRKKSKRDDIVHITLGSSLSSSYQNACLAAEQLKHVYVVNSNTLCSATGLQVLDAAKMAKEGKSGKEIKDYFDKHSQSYHISFILNTLDYIKAGGRCSSAVALASAAFNIKPVVIVDSYKNGALSVQKKYRGKLDKVLVKYVRDKIEQYDDIDYSTCIISCTEEIQGIKHYETIRKVLEKETPFEKIYETNASSTISSHCGPGCTAIAFKTYSNCL